MYSDKLNQSALQRINKIALLRKKQEILIFRRIYSSTLQQGKRLKYVSEQ